MNDCVRTKPRRTVLGKQGLSYLVGVSAKTGAKAIHLQLLEMPPGAKAKAHKHESHETALYVIEGTSGTFFGEHLEKHIIVHAGDFFYIPADVPHLPYCIGDRPCVAVIARTDPNEQESIVLLPHLEEDQQHIRSRSASETLLRRARGNI